MAKSAPKIKPKAAIGETVTLNDNQHIVIGHMAEDGIDAKGNPVEGKKLKYLLNPPDKPWDAFHATWHEEAHIWPPTQGVEAAQEGTAAP